MEQTLLSVSSSRQLSGVVVAGFCVAALVDFEADVEGMVVAVVVVGSRVEVEVVGVVGGVVLETTVVMTVDVVVVVEKEEVEVTSAETESQ